MLAVEHLNLNAYIVEGFHLEGVFNHFNIISLPFLIDGIALDEQTVGNVLEIAKDITLQGSVLNMSKLSDGTREADVLRVRIGHAPLTQQVASLTSLLTGDNEE